MKTYKLQAIALLGLAGFAANISAQVTITTETTMAPNAFGSPSWNAWIANGLTAAENNLSSYGAAGPSQFSVTTTPLPYTENFVTGFSSWEGQADQPAPYSGEFGTRASFVGIINGNGSLISIDNMGFYGASSDPRNLLGQGFSFPNDSVQPGDWTYDSTDVGIKFNNGVDASGGITIVDSGSPDQLVNEIISIGAGNAYPGYLGDDPAPGASDQDIINYDEKLIPNGYDFSGTFTYGAQSGTGTFDFSATAPDATATGALLVGSLAGLAGLSRRFNRA